jgi:Uma2 family endonuclease
MHARTRPTLYAQLEALPEGLTGEIIDGQVHTQPRPSGRHGLAESSLIGELIGPFQKGRGGPGGWWIIGEPELHFVRDTEVLVPDLAGWRRERMPQIPEDQRFTVIPDWVCEILSKPTASKDREIKMPAYAEYGVAYLWLIDPLLRTLEAYVREGRYWREIRRFASDDRVAVAPFDAVTIELADLWAPSV